MSREISKNFKQELTDKLPLGLHRILDLVKQDSSLCLQIREKYINIYYRGGNLLKIQETKGNFQAHFNQNYLSTYSLSNVPVTLKSYTDVTQWLDSIPLLKHQMDLFFGRNPKSEREFQQTMLRENNFKGIGRSTDYFICDIEYANADGRFDMIAVRWPSTSGERKSNKDLGLSFIEMKYGDGALSGSSGIVDHAKAMVNFCTHSNIKAIKDEMKDIFNQQLELGLIDCGKEICQFNDGKPEYIIVLANHDPDSSVLYRELNLLKSTYCSEELPFDLKFATSNFMGYGLYQQNIYDLDTFMARFSRQIYSKL